MKGLHPPVRISSVTPPRSLIATILCSAVVLSGCADTSSSSTEAPQVDTTHTSELGAEAFPVTIEHFRGSTTIPQKPQRIVSLDNSYTEILVALDEPVVGLSTSHGEKVPPYLTSEQRHLIEDAEEVGDLKTPSLEKIAALKPDLIISSDYRSKDYYDQLTQIAPTVFSEKAGTTWQDNILLAGEAVGKKAEGQRLLDHINKRAELIGEDIQSAGRNKTVSIVRFSPSLRLYNSLSFPGSMLDKVGIARPENQQGDPSHPNEIFTEFSAETIPAADADIILKMAPPKDSERRAQWESKANPILESSLWKELKGRQIEVNDEIWFLNVSPLAAELLLDDIASIYDVDPHDDIS